MQEHGILARLFWSRVNRNGPIPAHRPDLGPCWLWMGTKDKEGYGTLKFCLSVVRVSHIAFEMATGEELPSGMYVCHHCDNPPCVNPSHLFSGGAVDNNRDAVEKGRYIDRPAPNRPRGVEHPHVKLTEDQVRRIRDLYARGGRSYASIGADFGVSWSLVRNIVKRINWAHID